METLIALSVFAMILSITAVILFQASQSWRRISSHQGASTQLLKAEGWLRRDLEQASFSEFDLRDGLVSFKGKDGDVLWFLSAIAPATGAFIHDTDPMSLGAPYWQRNIVYYLATPQDLSAGLFSGPGVEVDGYEASCPYKILVRKEIDSGSPTNPTSNQPEKLLKNVTPYLKRPTNFQFAPKPTEKVDIAGYPLLGFRVKVLKDIKGLEITLQAARIEEASREFALGTRSLEDPRFLVERRFQIFPMNP